MNDHSSTITQHTTGHFGGQSIHAVDRIGNVTTNLTTTMLSEMINHHPRATVHRNAAIFELFEAFEFDHLLLP